MKTFIIILTALLSLIMSSFAWAQKTWTGGGDGLSWEQGANWSGGTVPISSDNVLLDHSTVSGSYTVNLPTGAITVAINKLTITPGAGNTIALILPSGNTGVPGLNVGDNTSGTDDLILDNGAILKNSSGAASGNGIQVNSTGNGTVRINNGGRYIHNTSRGTSGIVPRLSAAGGTQNGIFEYDSPGTGSATVSASGQTYGTLSLTRSAGAGTYVSSGASAITIRGDFLINSGVTFSSTMTGSMNLAGNLSNNGTFTSSSMPMMLNGAAGQTMGGNPITLTNLTINNASGVTLLTDETVSSTLTLASGNVMTGSHKMIIAPGGTVAPAGGYIIGNLQKNFATGTGVAQTFEIGDAANYAPIDVIMAVVSASGNVTATSTPGDHPQISSSTLDAGKSVNRYWTITSDGALGFTTYDATFHFAALDLDGSANSNNLIAGKFEAGTWTYPAVGTRTATSTQVVGVTGLGDFNLAELDMATPLADAGPDKSICAGAAATIGGAPTASGGFGGPYTISWAPNDGSLNNPNAANPSASPAATMTYTVTVTELSTGLVATDEVTITVNSLPMVSISGNDPIGAGATLTYTASTNASTPGYLWTVTNGTINGNNNQPAVSISAGTSGLMAIQLVVTDGTTTCSNTASKNVTIDSNALVANAGNDDADCLGATFNLNGAATGGSGAYTFLWSVQSGPDLSSTQFSNPAVEDPAFTPSSPGTYVLRFTIDDGTAAPVFDEVHIAAHALPAATASGDATICAGGSATISVALAGVPPWQITWSDGVVQSGVNSNAAIRVVHPSTTTVYTITNVTDANACSNSGTGSATITVNALPSASISGDNLVLTGTAHTYMASTDASSPSYEWSVTNGAIDGGITGSTLNVIAGSVGTMIVNLTVTDGLTACSNSAAQSVMVQTTAVSQLVFLADELVKIDQNKTSAGDIHCNGKIEFGRGVPGTHTGNLTARDEIEISSRNTIAGNATAGDDISLHGNAQVTGAVAENAHVTKIPLPRLSFTAGGPNKTVPKNGSLTLAPGRYNRVKVNQKGTLLLSAGDYFFNVLNTEYSAVLEIDVAGGSTNINVVKDLDFAASVQVQVTGGATSLVSFATLQDSKLNVGKKALIFGTLYAPRAKVHFASGSAFKGELRAETISLDARVEFAPHSATAVFTKVSEESDNFGAEIAASEISSYELEQNYPNPFNPTTMIGFTLPKASEVSLAIYNLNGQLVKRLVSGELSAGSRSVMWDAKDEHGRQVASGVYLYVLQAGDYVARKKLLLMK